LSCPGEAVTPQHQTLLCTLAQHPAIANLFSCEADQMYPGNSTPGLSMDESKDAILGCSLNSLTLPVGDFSVSCATLSCRVFQWSCAPGGHRGDLLGEVHFLPVVPSKTHFLADVSWGSLPNIVLVFKTLS
jgi:hypothetical protein